MTVLQFGPKACIFLSQQTSPGTLDAGADNGNCSADINNISILQLEIVQFRLCVTRMEWCPGLPIIHPTKPTHATISKQKLDYTITNILLIYQQTYKNIPKYGDPCFIKSFIDANRLAAAIQ